MTGQAVWLRRAGLTLGTLASAFWLFAVIVGVVGAGTPWSVEGLLLALLVAFGASALVVAWQSQRIGSVLLLVAGVCLALFAFLVAGRNQALIVLLLGGPFLLAGGLLRVGLAAAAQASGGTDHGEGS